MEEANIAEAAPNRADVGSVTLWLRLVRLPNLFTVPGDPIVGVVVAASVADTLPIVPTCLVAVAALFMYAAGTLLNDLVDVREDLTVTPWRPFARGLVERREIQRAVFACFAIGLLLAGFAGQRCLAVAGCLTLSIITYNFGMKRVAFLGPINMGLCRGLSVMLGVAVAWTDGALSYPGMLAALAVTIYVTCITGYARYERNRFRPPWITYLPIAGCALAVMLLAPVWTTGSVWNILGYMMLLCVVAMVSYRVLQRAVAPEKGEPHTNAEVCNPIIVGALVRAMIPMQAGMIWLGASSWRSSLVAMVVLLAWWPSYRLSGKFYAS